MAYKKKAIPPPIARQAIERANEEPNGYEYNVLKYLSILAKYPHVSQKASGLSMDVDENGRINFTGLPIVLWRQEIDVRRFRFCEICDKCVWATKSNQHTCSAKCAMALGHRKRKAKNV